MIVVTGSAGFIGRALVAALAERGPVVGIDRLPQPAVPGLSPITADLLDGDPRVRAALAGAAQVYHLAGCPDVRDARPDIAERRYRDNVLATGTVLAAVPLDVPLLVTSSSSVYGGTRAGRPSAEHHRVRPQGGYASSKVVVEHLCTARAHAGGRVAVVRPFTVAGEGQRPGMAVAQWVAAVREGRPVRVFGSPARSRDLTDVREAVRALCALGELLAAGTGIGTVNLGTGRAVRLDEIVAAVGRVLGRPAPIVVDEATDVEVAHTLADVTHLRGLLGWVPSTDLDALVARQVAATSPAAAPALVG